MKKTLCVIAIAATSLVGFAGTKHHFTAANNTAAVSSSDQSSQVIGKGVYLGLGLGYGGEKTAAGWVFRDGSTSNEGFVASFDAGYQFNPYVGLELGASMLPSKLSDNYTLVDFVVKGILPFENGMRLFGKAGVANLSASTSGSSDGSNSSFYAGLGVGYAFNQHFELGVEGDSMVGADQLNAWKTEAVGTYHF